MTVQIDAYTPPASTLAGAPELIPLSDAERVRNTHIDHEAAIRSIGVLYILTGTILLAPIASLPLAVNAEPDAATDFLIGGALIGTMAGVYLALGFGVRRLAVWSRVPTCLLSLLSLLAFPLGTLLGGYVLYLFLCEKGRFVLTERYAAVVDLTPHIKRRTGLVVKLAVGLLIASGISLALVALLD